MPTVNFERGPSNEQTLLSELGEARRALEKSAWNERELEGSLAMARQHIVLLQKERDALAVAAEGLKKAYRLQRKGMESMAELQDGLKQEVRTQAEQIKQLRESLEWALDHLHLFADSNPGYAPAVAILKETAP